jgi:hypothetical protein
MDRADLSAAIIADLGEAFTALVREAQPTWLSADLT